jgi:hypothetical protein
MYAVNTALFTEVAAVCRQVGRVDLVLVCFLPFQRQN